MKKNKRINKDKKKSICLSLIVVRKQNVVRGIRSIWLCSRRRSVPKYLIPAEDLRFRLLFVVDPSQTVASRIRNLSRFRPSFVHFLCWFRQFLVGSANIWQFMMLDFYPGSARSCCSGTVLLAVEKLFPCACQLKPM